MENVKVKIQKDNVILTLCDEFGQCHICNSLIKRKNRIIADDIIEEFKKIKRFVSIKLKIVPSKITESYFSIFGVNNIVSKFFKTNDRIVRNELFQVNGVIKVYFLKNIIHIELFFFNDLGKETKSHFEKVINGFELYSDSGEIEMTEHFHPNGIYSQSKLFSIPDYEGKGSFTNDIELLDIGLPQKDLKELDMLMGIGLKRFNGRDYFKSKPHTLFELERSVNANKGYSKRNIKSHILNC
jgi:hypothetical protein